MARRAKEEPEGSESDEAVRLNVYMGIEHRDVIAELGKLWKLKSRSAIIQRALLECADIGDYLERGYKLIMEDKDDPKSKTLLATKNRFL